jgi:hypothetical protein
MNHPQPDSGPDSNINSPYCGSGSPVLWIRIRKDPKLFAGSGSVTRGYGSESETGHESYRYKNLQKISNLIIMTLKIHYSNIFFEKFALKSIKSPLKSLALGKSEC